MNIEYHSLLRAAFGGKLPSGRMPLEEVVNSIFRENGWGREALVREFAWAIPSDEALHCIAEHGPIVELGAGSGYWAYLLGQLGIDVVALDRYVNSKHKHWVDVQRGGAKALRRHSGRTLFLCWPPYDTNMADNALRIYRGSTLAYIGEGHGGCTGNDLFYNRLDRYWEEIESVAIPQWPMVHDTLSVYQRKVKG